MKCMVRRGLALASMIEAARRAEAQAAEAQRPIAAARPRGQQPRVLPAQRRLQLRQLLLRLANSYDARRPSPDVREHAPATADGGAFSAAHETELLAKLPILCGRLLSL